MPQVIALPVAYLGAFLFNAGVVGSLGTALFVSQALVYGGLALGAAALSLAVVRPTLPDGNTAVPKPEDGAYNLKQSIPSLPYVLGRVKKGSDYLLLEQANGTAYHIMCWAGHRIHQFVDHYLHDEKVTLDGTHVVAPAHFNLPDLGWQGVFIETRIGNNASAAYSDVISVMPSIYTADHRGDGLATVRVSVATPPQEEYLKAYPNQMPQHSAVGDGMRLYDPRTGTTAFSTNLALMRLWHLTHPVGGKMALSDMYLPDWITAANVCDEEVTNRDGGSEYRYHGGFWFRASTDPRQVGLIMDQAAELVVYERSDGKIGVHAGKYVEPDITLTQADVIRLSLDVNERQESTVLAVRGQWTNPDELYSTVDAAIYGDPYVGDDDTQRTKTIANQAVQSHNHCQRLQKLTYIRANAAKVSIVATYASAKLVRQRRFVRVNVPPRLNNVVVEITSNPTISLRNMTVGFSGLIVPEGLYDFVAATEEGTPGSPVILLDDEGVPDPEGFAVEIQSEALASGGTAAFAVASWDAVNVALTYELEWEPTNGSAPAQRATSKAGETELRSAYLSDGLEYKFRLRTWSVNVASDWTSYETLTATADPTPPSVATGVSATGGAASVAFNWTAPNSANYVGARIYLNTANTMTGASLVATEYGAPSAADTRTVSGVSPAGTYYGFVVAINGSGIEATPVATGSITVT